MIYVLKIREYCMYKKYVNLFVLGGGGRSEADVPENFLHCLLHTWDFAAMRFPRPQLVVESKLNAT
jgi:hypothetical protein